MHTVYIDLNARKRQICGHIVAVNRPFVGTVLQQYAAMSYTMKYSGRLAAELELEQLRIPTNMAVYTNVYDCMFA
jgi:hypothetical protein